MYFFINRNDTLNTCFKFVKVRDRRIWRSINTDKEKRRRTTLPHFEANQFNIRCFKVGSAI